MDDGGLSRARADLRSQTDAWEQQRQAEREAVHRALENQTSRVREATTAFLQQAPPLNCRKGYKLFEHREGRPFGGSYSQALVMWQSGTLELEDDRAKEVSIGRSHHTPPGVLPFHCDPCWAWRGRYGHGPYPTGDTAASKINVVEETTDFFVAVLAGYLEGHGS
jgi:hypothetical protein